MNPLPVAAVAAALFAATAVAAPAQEPTVPARTAPVSVVGCTLSAAVPVLLSEGGTMSAGPALLVIDFVNHAAVDATSVRFHVRAGSAEQTIEDTGRFAGGTLIEHQLVPSFINAVAGPTSCEVIGVGFEDGSTWDAQTAPVFPELGGGGG